MKKAVGCAKGRVVITGEHSVIYGAKALVSELDLETTVTITKVRNFGKQNEFVEWVMEEFSDKYGVNTDDLFVKIESEIPIGSGLSSSTALVTSLIRGLCVWFGVDLSKEQLLDLVIKIESRSYPVSGMDQTVVVLGGLIVFERINGKLVSKELSDTTKKVDLVLINSGEPSESTAEMVAKVKELKPKIREKIVGEMALVSEEIIESFEKGLWKPELIRKNERLLEALGVVGEKAMKIISEVENIGGVAKICGAGGVKSGSGMLLCWNEDSRALVDYARKNKLQYFEVKV